MTKISVFKITVVPEGKRVKKYVENIHQLCVVLSWEWQHKETTHKCIDEQSRHRL